MKKLSLLLFTLLACLPLSAQVTLSFSGGSGSPLTVTVENDVTFQLTANGNKFDFVEFSIPGFTSLSEGSIAGTFGFTTNGGALTTFEAANGTSGTLLLFTLSSTWTVGDLVTLHAGSFTTSANYAGSLPADGSYSAMLVDNNLNAIATVSAVPEPSTYAALFGLSALGVAAVVRQRRRMATA